MGDLRRDPNTRAIASPMPLKLIEPEISTDSDSAAATSLSNTQCNVSAPGVAVSSAKLGGGLVSWNGTSMATPHVSGVAALWAQKELQESGRITSQNMTARVLAMATRNGLESGVELDYIGNGIVQAP